jgi:hypothetical protein
MNTACAIGSPASMCTERPEIALVLAVEEADAGLHRTKPPAASAASGDLVEQEGVSHEAAAGIVLHVEHSAVVVGLLACVIERRAEGMRGGRHLGGRAEAERDR